MTPDKLKHFDLDQDGKVSVNDAETFTKINTNLIDSARDKNQARLAWVAMISMILITLLLFTPLIGDARVASLENILDLFYIAQASVIGFYYGVKAYLSRGTR